MAEVKSMGIRRERNADAVAARLKVHPDNYTPPEGVQILNPGRFRIERMHGVGVKRRDKLREKVNG